jgi:hypothetical protein
VGLQKPLPVARGCWERVGVDVITDMLTSFRGNKYIVTFVDHFSKSVDLMPFTKTFDTAEFAQLFCEAIIQLHGAPARLLATEIHALRCISRQKRVTSYRVSCSCECRFTHKQTGCQRSQISRSRGIFRHSPLTIKTSGTPCLHLQNIHITHLSTALPIEAWSNSTQDIHHLWH